MFVFLDFYICVFLSTLYLYFVWLFFLYLVFVPLFFLFCYLFVFHLWSVCLLCAAFVISSIKCTVDNVSTFYCVFIRSGTLFVLPPCLSLVLCLLYLSPLTFIHFLYTCVQSFYFLLTLFSSSLCFYSCLFLTSLNFLLFSLCVPSCSVFILLCVPLVLSWLLALCVSYCSTCVSCLLFLFLTIYFPCLSCLSLYHPLNLDSMK